MCSSPGKNFILTEIMVAVAVVIEEWENWFLSKMGKKKQVKWLSREMQTASDLCKLRVSSKNESSQFL